MNTLYFVYYETCWRGVSYCKMNDVVHVTDVPDKWGMGPHIIGPYYTDMSHFVRVASQNDLTAL